ncbi:unnamed protein product [Paramecium pentaurelia]|uniref:Uncharacterized protein n=1 Tax=Paramecium pentaurelia TaxID=43138 RepID=A0A8S1SRR5_9CILI|nr:unnamed protein product [Paramecium pentaurelia]
MSKKYDLQRIKLNKIKSNLQSYIQLINFTILTERADNVQLKKQAIKSEAIIFKKQKDDIKNEKNVIVQENRKIKQEINIWEDKHHNLVKCAAETEPKVEANKDLANESDERLNGLKIDQKKRRRTIFKNLRKIYDFKSVIILEIVKKEQQMNFNKLMKTYSKVRFIQQIAKLYFIFIDKKLIKQFYSDLNEQVLFYQVEQNEQKLKRSEIKRLLYQLDNRLKDFKFQREILLVRVQDFDRIIVQIWSYY